MLHETLRIPSLPIVEDGVLAQDSVQGLDMRSWYEERPYHLIAPCTEEEKAILNLDILQATLNQRMREFCQLHGLSHRVVQTANLHNWFLRSLRRPGEEGPPETLPPTPTLSAGNPEETAVYASVWGLAELSEEQREKASRFIRTMEIDLTTRKLPNKILSVRQRCLRVKDFDRLDSFHNPTFNMDGNNYLGTNLKPAEFVKYWLDTIEALGFDPSDMYVTYHPGGVVNIVRDKVVHDQVFIPELTEATKALREWFTSKNLTSNDHLYAFSPEDDKKKMGAVWGPGGNAYQDKNGKQIYGPFGPHFEIFIKIGGVYHELANGIFKRYIATEEGIYTLGANEERVAQAYKGIHTKEEVPTVSMEGVIGDERTLALLDFLNRKDDQRPREIKSTFPARPWDKQDYLEDGPNVFAVPGTSTHAVVKYLADNNLVLAGAGDGFAYLKRLVKPGFVRHFSSHLTVLAQLYHSGYSFTDAELERQLKSCRRLLKNPHFTLVGRERTLSWECLIKELEQTIIASDPEFFRRRREGFMELFLGIHERKQFEKVLKFIRGRDFVKALDGLVKEIETSPNQVKIDPHKAPENIKKLLRSNGVDEKEAYIIWRLLTEPLVKIYEEALLTFHSRQGYNSSSSLTKAIDVLEGRETAPRFKESVFTKLLRQIPELAEIAELSKRNVFPDNLSLLQKLLVVRTAALDRLLQLQLLKAYAVECEYADHTRRQVIENEVAQKFSIKIPMAQKVLEAVGALELSPNMVSTVLDPEYRKDFSKLSTTKKKIESLIRRSNTKKVDLKILLDTLNKNAQEVSREMIRMLSNSSNSKKT